MLIIMLLLFKNIIFYFNHEEEKKKRTTNYTLDNYYFTFTFSLALSNALTTEPSRDVTLLAYRSF